MATVKELKATARPACGKGAARVERRAGRVPGVIYGNNQPPVTISVEDAELRQRILAGARADDPAPGRKALDVRHLGHRLLAAWLGPEVGQEARAVGLDDVDHLDEQRLATRVLA